ncbi:uncharacterized protein [Montipora capricornis]|uniref:uncharacterized protein n=1 Tax=Montipora capricornis TaxID=246305 RepID=UPI0035F1C2AA
MEATHFLSVLFLVILATTAAQQCSKISGRDCSKDTDCACSRHESIEPHFICNYKLKCGKKSIFDAITRRLPCFRVHKQTCTTDAECPMCAESRLICEDGECVRETP